MQIGITSIFQNCNYENYFLIEGSANSKIELKIELAELVSLQSRKLKRDELVAGISQELSKFKWIISGAVSIQFHWYLSHHDRHETDKTGDLDNLTKPILDSLIGESGLLIDDCQVSELYIQWISKNESFASSFLKIWIDFDNDYCLYKENLFFVQYHNAMCAAFDTKFSDQKNLFGIKVVLWTKMKARRLSSNASFVNTFMLTYSPFDFHRTRLQKFHKSRILTRQEFNEKFPYSKSAFRDLLAFMRRLGRK